MSKQGKENRTRRRHPQQDHDARMALDISNLKMLCANIMQKVELMSALSAQIVVTMVLLKEKGVITDDEVKQKHEELKQPIEDGIARVGSEVSGGAVSPGETTEETGPGDSKEAGNAGTTGTDGHINSRVSESSEVQSEDSGTPESNSRCTESGLLNAESSGSTPGSKNDQGGSESDVPSEVSEPTRLGDTTDNLGKD